MPPQPTTARRLLRSRAGAAAALAAVVAVALGAYLLVRPAPVSSRVEGVSACRVPREILERVWRGYYPGRSGDVVTVEWFPNLYGNRHSTPWPYTQEVPLVLYGPGFVQDGITSARDVTVADIAPTMAELLEFKEFGRRDGRVLHEALLPKERRNGVPRLIFTLVWDGVGDNVLRQWPGSWPNLKALMGAGADYRNATVGSSPSLTPAIHATIGTGHFPATHGLPDTKLRVKGKMVDSWQNFSPQHLEVTTLADEWDAARDNEPLVGMMARDSWHAGMIGHGAFLPGGDKDIGVFDDLADIEFRSRPKFYSMPDYLNNTRGLRRAIDEVDRRDGRSDGRWRGNPLTLDGRIRYGPQWAIYQTERLRELLQKEGFGADDTPDLFFTNYKSGDLAGHEWNMVEPEMKDVVEEQDRQLKVLIAMLDELVGKNRYVLVLTADHGMTPYPRVLGGWRVEMRDVTADLNRRFRKVAKRRIVAANRGYYVWLDERSMRSGRVTAEDVAAYLRDYRIRDNVSPTNKLTKKFEPKKDERVYLTALSQDELRDAIACVRARDEKRT